MSGMCSVVATMVMQLHALHVNGVSQQVALESYPSVPAEIVHSLVTREYSPWPSSVPVEDRALQARLSCETEEYRLRRPFDHEHRPWRR